MTETPRQAAKRLAKPALDRGFVPEALHEYKTAEGTTIYWRIRAKHPTTGEKWIRPMRLHGQGYELGEPDFPNGKKPLYRLDAIAANPAATIYIPEGEKPADALAKIGVATTTSGGATSASAADWEPARGKTVVIFPDADDAGKVYAGEVAAILLGIGCKVSVIDVDALGLPPKGDAIEWLAAHPNASLSELEALPHIEAQPAAENATVSDLMARVAELAVMPALEYERIRDREAKRLGARVTTLDKEVNRLRRDGREDTAAGRPLEFTPHEPWPEPVDGATLLDSLVASVRRYVILQKHAAVALALWVVFTYLLDAAAAAPILAILSPEKRCGKTTLLDWLRRLVHRELATSNILPAALFRSIEKWQPTLLVDEADTFLKENNELRGILNSGHTRASAFVIRTVGDEHEPRRFSTWGAKAIALIGKLPDTLADRSITIQMRRKLPSERVHKLRGRAEMEGIEHLARKCARFAADNLSAVKGAEPSMPDGLNDRAADSWAPLLAIADVAGGDWPKLAREAASALSGATPDGDSSKVELLSDVRAIVTKLDAERVASSDLAAMLAADPERPWAEFNHGKAITQRQLAKLLGAFGIVSGTVELSDGRNLKGYKVEGFADAFARYLPPADPSDRQKRALARVLTDLASVNKSSLDGSTHPSEASTGAGSDGMTDREHPCSKERSESSLYGYRRVTAHRSSIFDRCGLAFKKVAPESPIDH